MAEKVKEKVSKETGRLGKSYLFLYNFFQVLGWSYLFFLLTKFYITSPKDVLLWDNVKIVVCLFQNAALLEVVHTAVGLVPSNLFVTTFQVLSRVMVVCGVLLATPTAPVSPGLPLALYAWTITEIIRYLYYALNIVHAAPHVLVWCRYTFFMVLYPIGVTGELLCFYAAQAYVANNKMWSLEMPNKLNFTFSYHYILLFVMFLYIPLFPQIFLHMIAQRRKVLGGASTVKKRKYK